MQDIDTGEMPMHVLVGLPSVRLAFISEVLKEEGYPRMAAEVLKAAELVAFAEKDLDDWIVEQRSKGRN